MSSCAGRWVELSSQHERLALPDESSDDATANARMSARSQWAELASQSERLADASDPLFRLASSSHGVPGMRLITGAA